jgi:hypothetical protein
MLAHHRKTVYISLISKDLPIWQMIESTASVYQKDRDRFHVLLNQQTLSTLPGNLSSESEKDENNGIKQQLLWLEISPYRVMMTVQNSQSLSYRHFWERGVYGVSRYWLNGNPQENGSLRLRNFTRSLKLEGHCLPTSVQIEYELWSAKLPLGIYIFHVDIDS